MSVKAVRAGAIVLVVCVTISQAQLTPYTYDCPIQAGSNVSFTLSQYPGDQHDSGTLIHSWSGSSGISGSLTATLWRDPTGAFTDIRMDHMSLSGSDTIPQGGWTDWFMMDTSLGETRVRGQIQNLQITDYVNSTINQASVPVSSGAFTIPDYETQMYGNLAVEVQYKVPFLGWLTVTTITEDLSDHNTPPPSNSVSGTVSGAGGSATLSSMMDQAVYEYMNPHAQAYGITCDYTVGVSFTSYITAVATGTPVMQLWAEANGGYTAWSEKPLVLSSTGSYDPQGIGITSYAWDLNNDGTFETVGSSPVLTRDQLAAMGLTDGFHSVGLKVTDGDGYWATDIASLALYPHMPGDANGDGRVTFEDFAVLQNHYGQATDVWTRGNFNFDGVVDFADFALLQNYYGQAGGVGQLGLAPEPVSLCFLGFGALTVLRRRSRR